LSGTATSPLGVPRVECRIDGALGSWSSGAGPRWNFRIAPGAPGTLTSVELRAYDYLGKSTPATVVITRE